MKRLFLVLTGLFAVTAVALGAFAAHGLKDLLTPALLSAFQTGVHYHLLHALALGLVALALTVFAQQPQPVRWLCLSGWLFIAGILLFSGSLYGLSLTGFGWLGPITPLGGLSFLLGWICFMIAAFKTK
ncbi:MAG TPA: DUF423 domain-containing protein [Cellvibrionaceae bacterium]